MSIAELLLAGEWVEALYQLPFMIIESALIVAIAYFTWLWIRQSAERDHQRKRREQWIDEQIGNGR